MSTVDLELIGFNRLVRVNAIFSLYVKVDVRLFVIFKVELDKFKLNLIKFGVIKVMFDSIFTADRPDKPIYWGIFIIIYPLTYIGLLITKLNV